LTVEADVFCADKSVVIMQVKMERKEPDEPAQTETTEWHGRQSCHVSVPCARCVV